MSPIEKLLAIEEIKNLKARYFRFVDSHDWENFRSLFIDDAVFSVPKGPRPDFATHFFTSGEDYRGADKFLAYAQRGLETAHSNHMGYMPEIEILTADTARGIWGMHDILRYPGREFHGHGYYREEYVRRNGKWLISKWSLFYKSARILDLGTTGSPVV